MYKPTIQEFLVVVLLFVIIWLIYTLYYKDAQTDKYEDIYKIVYFYRPSCPFCIKFMPKWDDFEELCEKRNVDIEIKKINTQKPDNASVKELKILEQVKFVPALVFYNKNGTHFIKSGSEFMSGRQLYDTVV